MAKILWAFLSIAGGFVTVVVLIGSATFLIRRTVPEWMKETSPPSRSYLLANLGSSLVGGLAGGYVTGWIARENPLVYTLGLAIVVLLLGALSALQLRGKQPILYQLLLTACTPIAVFTGGLLRLRLMGLY